MYKLPTSDPKSSDTNLILFISASAPLVSPTNLIPICATPKKLASDF